MMGRWIFGSVLALALLLAALSASSSANPHDQSPALNDHFATDIAAPGQ
jgi:hypothetical protein